MGLDITGIGSVFDFGSKIIDKIWPDKAQADQIKLQMLQAQQAGEFKEMDQALELAKAQIAANAVEAANPSMFVAGWRPGIGWVCVAALFYQYLFRPIAPWVGAAAGHSLPAMPGLDDTLWQLLAGMLGISGMRTFEKVKGVDTTGLSKN